MRIPYLNISTALTSVTREPPGFERLVLRALLVLLTSDLLSLFLHEVADFSVYHLHAVVNQNIGCREKEQDDVGLKLEVGVLKLTVH
jgi:hypothetical protein